MSEDRSLDKWQNFIDNTETMEIYIQQPYL